jgi:hypothetical protein
MSRVFSAVKVVRGTQLFILSYPNKRKRYFGKYPYLRKRFPEIFVYFKRLIRAKRWVYMIQVASEQILVEVPSILLLSDRFCKFQIGNLRLMTSYRYREGGGPGPIRGGDPYRGGPPDMFSRRSPSR